MNSERNGQTVDVSLSAQHPVGLGFGAASGVMAGAAIGSAVAGPVGAAVGAMFGGLLGACGGHGIAHAVDGSDPVEPLAEDKDGAAGDPDMHDVPNFAQIRGDSVRVHEHFASLVLPWDNVRPFTDRGWDRLSGVVAPRDPDRGLRGGI